MNRHPLILFLATVLLCACDRQGVSELAPFLMDNTVRLELDGVKVFTYSESTCQLAFNEKRAEFRAQTDTMLDYFVLKLDGVPTRTGTRVEASLAWSTKTGESTKENITLDVKRISGDVIWLCDADRRIAAVVKVLE